MSVIDDDDDEDNEDNEDNSSTVRKNKNVVFRDSSYLKLRKYLYWPETRPTRVERHVDVIVWLSHILQNEIL